MQIVFDTNAIEQTHGFALFSRCWWMEARDIPWKSQKKSGSRWLTARSRLVIYVEALKCYFMHSFGSMCKSIWRLLSQVIMCQVEIWRVLNQPANLNTNVFLVEWENGFQESYLFMKSFLAVTCLNLYYTLIIVHNLPTGFREERTAQKLR